MIYLSLEDAIDIANRVVSDVQILDMGLLDSAMWRPQAVAFGVSVYPTVHLKAAALVQSVVKNHALFDGNKRLGLACLLAFLGYNGFKLTLTNKEAFNFIMAIADSPSPELEDIAKYLETHTEPW